ncbi:MAG TPA: zinc-dependent alcohol dehydrogenase [Bryobacteraceae bacterium]|jgi:threonine dehydrogenase-like Zn-dependent dehydrogenase
MKATRWHGKHEISVDSVPDPVILDTRDAIIRVTATAICGSDLHIYDGVIPTMEDGDILGHEFMGVVEEVGKQNGLKKGDRVIVPFQIACGHCHYCQRGLTALCDNTNPNADKMRVLYGQPAAGLFGYSHLYGGYPGGQAEYVRVPCADYGAFKVPDELTDEQVLFLTDIFPTGFMGAENCGIEPGQTVAVWGCGPVGQFAIRSAFLLGAERVIALDDVPERLEMARAAGAETLDDGEHDLQAKLRQLTHGRGPDHCIDCVGMEAHGTTVDAVYDRVKTAVMLETDRSHALRSAIQACAKGGTVSIPGVYGGLLDKFPLGAAFAKGLTLKMGQTNVHRYLPRLLDYILKGKIDPSFVITHRLPLQDAATAYKTFHDKADKCIKVVLKPASA